MCFCLPVLNLIMKFIYVLPSSIHELILVPDNGDMNKNHMMQMVREVNSTEVRPDEI